MSEGEEKGKPTAWARVEGWDWIGLDCTISIVTMRVITSIK